MNNLPTKIAQDNVFYHNLYTNTIIRIGYLVLRIIAFVFY